MPVTRILLLDNYDSFTYNLYDYFLQLNTECTVVRNDEASVADLKKLTFDALVLSPGPKKPADAGIMMELIDTFHQTKPILGICLGHQGIGEYFGAKLVNAQTPMHGKTSTLHHAAHPFFEQLPPSFPVMRYHSLILEKFAGTPLQNIAWTATGEIMALQHESLPLTGVQFHPESILTPHGMQLLQNWLTIFVKNTP